jgi:WAS/WASL-interacting protein
MAFRPKGSSEAQSHTPFPLPFSHALRETRHPSHCPRACSPRPGSARLDSAPLDSAPPGSARSTSKLPTAISRGGDELRPSPPPHELHSSRAPIDCHRSFHAFVGPLKQCQALRPRVYPLYQCPRLTRSLPSGSSPPMTTLLPPSHFPLPTSHFPFPLPTSPFTRAHTPRPHRPRPQHRPHPQHWPHHPHRTHPGRPGLPVPHPSTLTHQPSTLNPQPSPLALHPRAHEEDPSLMMMASASPADPPLPPRCPAAPPPPHPRFRSLSFALVRPRSLSFTLVRFALPRVIRASPLPSGASAPSLPRSVPQPM